MNVIDLESIVLKAGGHATREQGLCFNEAAAYFAGQPHSDSPPCVCPVIRRFTMRLNDRIADDIERTALLRPLIPVVVGTVSTRAVEIKRAYMAIDFAVRIATPQWLDLRDELKAHAVALRGLAPIVDAKTAGAAVKATRAARDDAWKAREQAVVRLRKRIAAIAAIAAIDASAAIAAIAAIDAIDASAASAAIAASAASAAIAAIDASAASAAIAAIDASAAIAASAAIRTAAYAAVRKFFAEGPGKAVRDSQLVAAAELVRAMAAVKDEASHE